MLTLRRKKRRSAPSGSYSTTTGLQFTSRVAETIAEKSWYWVAINLAWTAGPLTMMSIAIGHAIGYGTQPSSSQLIYFVSYTTVSGLGAVAANLIRDAWYEPRIKQEQETLLVSVDWLYYLLLHIRDLTLQSLSEADRRIMAAYYMLRSGSGAEERIRHATLALTSDTELAGVLEQVVCFREQGMHTLAEDLYQKYKIEIGELHQQLAESAPITSKLLSKWIAGTMPPIAVGRPRDEGFLQRALNAADESDPSAMTVSDAFEIVSLVFELLNGRRITALETRFSGDDRLESAAKKLGDAHRRYRRALQKRNGAIRLLLDDMDSTHLVERLPDESKQQKALVSVLMEELASLPLDERSLKQFEYQKISKLHRQCLVHRQTLQSKITTYRQVLQEMGGRLTLSLEKESMHRDGFYIKQRSIKLSDAQKLVLAHSLNGITTTPPRTLDELDVKELAMDLTSELNEHIDLSNREVQAAIEASNALQIGHLKASFTPSGKVGYARQAISSMHENSMKAAHTLCQSLATLYQVPISEPLIELLISEFGADRDHLNELASKQASGALTKAAIASSPMELPEWSEIMGSEPQRAEHGYAH